MARNDFTINSEATYELLEAMERYGNGCGRIIDKVLWNEGGPLINDSIMRLLPVSGRNWAGKKRAAKSAKPFEQKNDSLSVTIRTKGSYHYLYFPDDGSNTKRHRGGQDFMRRGAENQADEIINRCVEQLIEKFGE